MADVAGCAPEWYRKQQDDLTRQHQATRRAARADTENMLWRMTADQRTMFLNRLIVADPERAQAIAKNVLK
jgi:hypothetical protein